MVPALGISYHSASDNGLLGVGWNLSGLHSITRDPSFGIKYDGTDHFISTLGGQLVFTAGYYYHKKENYIRIQAFDTCGKGPCYFVATDQNGMTYTFGNTIDSRIEAVSSSIAPANSVRVWALSEVRDVFGNKYIINYKEDSNTGNYYPENIYYNNRTIAFSYEDKPETTPSYTYGSLVNENKRITGISIQVDGNEINSYRFSYSNTSVNKKSLLQNIYRKGYNSLDFTYSNNPVMGSFLEKAMNTLQLIYQVRNPVRDTSPAGSTAPYWEHHAACVFFLRQCFIRDLPVCNPSAPVSPCLSPGEKSQSARDCNLYTITASDPCLNGKNITDSKWWLVDIDGDGAMDFANLHGTEDSGKFQAEVTRKLATTPAKDESLKTFNLHVNSFIGVADMNGDRKTDLVYSKLITENRIVGYTQKCRSEPTQNPNSPRTVCEDDLTKPIYNAIEIGQGLAILFSDGTKFDIDQDTDIGVYAHKPNYWDEHAATIPNIFLGDLNGDGLSDVVEEVGGQLKVSLTFIAPDGKLKFNKSVISIPDLGGGFKQLADMDGDGKAEYISIKTDIMNIVTFNTVNPNAVSITITRPRVDIVDTSSVYDPKKTNLNDVVDRPYEGLHWLADINGDGKLDYVFQKRDKVSVCVNLFDGKSFGREECTEITNLPYREFTRTNSIADVNGDGMADFLISDGISVRIAYSDGKKFIMSTDKPGIPNLFATADLNGDGKADFISVKLGDNGSWAGTLKTYSNSGALIGNDLLANVSNKEQSVDITYQAKSTLKDAIPTTSNYPILPDGSPEYLVTKVTFHPNGGLQDQIKTYTFKGKRTFAGTPDVRADLGFETMEVVDETTKSKSIVTYDQSSYKLAGITKSSVSFNGLGQKTAESSLTSFMPYSTAWGTYTPRVYSSSSNQYKNGSLLVTKNKSIPTDSTGYDAYGNILTSNVTVGANTIQTKNSYQVDTAKWVLNKMQTMQKFSDGVPVLENSIVYSGDSISSMQKRVSGGQTATTYFDSYDSYGNPTSMKDANGNTTTIIYDPVLHKFPIEVINAKNHKITTTYDINNGNILTKTDQNGATTVNSYDSLGRLIQVTYPGSSGWNEEYEYNKIGKPGLQNIVKKVREVNSLTILQTSQFSDGLGRVIKKESTGLDGSYLVTEIYTYNVDGTLWAKSNPYLAGKETAKYTYYKYDSDMNVNKIDYPDGRIVTTSNNGLTFSTQEFASDGSLLRTTVEVKNEISKTVSKTVQGLITCYSYDKAGRVTTINSPGGGQTTITYDFAGRKTSQTDKNSGTSIYKYDLVGNLISQTDAIGNIITMEYDSLGRPTRKVKPEGEIKYTYDENNFLGKLTQVVDDSGTTSLKYDSVGRMIERKTTTDNPEVIFRYEYDTLSRVTKMYYPDGTAVNSVFAPSGHLNQITMDSRDSSILNSPVVTYELDLDNSNKFIRTTGNEVKTTINFDALTNRPTRLYYFNQIRNCCRKCFFNL